MHLVAIDLLTGWHQAQSRLIHWICCTIDIQRHSHSYNSCEYVLPHSQNLVTYESPEVFKIDFRQGECMWVNITELRCREEDEYSFFSFLIYLYIYIGIIIGEINSYIYTPCVVLRFLFQISCAYVWQKIIMFRVSLKDDRLWTYGVIFEILTWRYILYSLCTSSVLLYHLDYTN